MAPRVAPLHSMVWLLPAGDPACYTSGVTKRSSSGQPSLKPAVKHVTLATETIKRFTVIHRPTGTAVDLCSRRSSGRGHLLCKQGVTAV